MDPVMIGAITDLIRALGDLLAPLLAGWLLPQPKFAQRKDEQTEGK